MDMLSASITTAPRQPGFYFFLKTKSKMASANSKFSVELINYLFGYLDIVDFAVHSDILVIFRRMPCTPRSCALPLAPRLMGGSLRTSPNSQPHQYQMYHLKQEPPHNPFLTNQVRE